jgi:hypothetical protein
LASGCLTAIHAVGCGLPGSGWTLSVILTLIAQRIQGIGGMPCAASIGYG